MIFRDDETRRAWEALHEGRAPPPALPEATLARLPDLAGRHVLHLFPGRGRATAELVAAGALVTAVDPADEAAESVRERAPGAAVLQADPHELPLQLRRGRFDAVVLVDALDRVGDLGALLAAAASALRPGGNLVVADRHPAAASVDPIDLRWREDYFERPTLGALVTAVAASGLTVRALDELPSPQRQLDRRVPARFSLVATKPERPTARA